jgi:hypothetical protein
METAESCVQGVQTQSMPQQIWSDHSGVSMLFVRWLPAGCFHFSPKGLDASWATYFF